MDLWFEEDEEVFVHLRAPYHRFDVIPSSRHVTVSLNGQLLAESRRPRLLFEAGLPVGYYLPEEDVDLDLLVPATLVAAAPTRGSLRIGR